MKNNIIIYSIIILVLFISYKIYLESEYIHLKCIISTVDGNKYCVRDRKNIKEAGDLLARTVNKLNKLIEILNNSKYKEQNNVKYLIKNYNPRKIYEILPTSQYTAYSENKGRKIAFCLNKEKNNNNNLIDDNTLMFVALHELAHLSTRTVGHDDFFWKNFKFLIKVSSENNLYTVVDYKLQNTNYCGMQITNNPFFDY
jgi:hypothetical protein